MYLVAGIFFKVINNAMFSEMGIKIVLKTVQKNLFLHGGLFHAALLPLKP